MKRGGVVVTINGIPDAKFARGWGLPLPLVWAIGVLNCRIDRLAKKSGAHYEFLFMRPSGEELEAIGALVEQGVIKPVIDRTFPLASAAEAMAYVEAGHAVGKVVVRIPD